MNELIQRIWKRKRFSYKQLVLGVLGGLLGVLVLVSLVVVYSELSVKNLETVSRGSGNRAETVAGRSDKCAETQSFNRGGVFSEDGIELFDDREWSRNTLRNAEEETYDYSFLWKRFAVYMLFTGTGFAAAAYLFYRSLQRLMRSAVMELEKDAAVEEKQIQMEESNTVLMENGRKLQEMILQKQDKLQEMFEMRLLKGDVTLWEEYDEYIEGFGLHPLSYYATLVAVLDLREENEAQDNVKEDAICLKIVEEMPKHLKSLAWLPPIYNACAVIAIVGEEDKTLLFDRIQEYYTGLQKYTEDVYGCRILMGVSATHSNPKEVRKAYKESVRALTKSEAGKQEKRTAPEYAPTDCRFYFEGGSASGIPYNAEYEKKMQGGIKNIDKVQCYKAADAFFRYLSEGNCNQDEIMVYTLRFVNAILLTAMEVKVDPETVFPEGLRKMYDDLLEILEPSRERRYIKKNLVDPILEIRRNLMQKRSYSILEDVEQLIREHRGNISLAECAEIMEVHPSYIWKSLKEEKGKSFSDFLEEYKLEEAKRLLLNTTMTVAEIASALNYTNAQNFIRFFSKSTGVTPGKFRKLY
ncbi:MAG: helix-turn-helix transcriptional regulator [Lachnospiraceae bacterium]|nr:helix-turn-helix transcriptional regulator [Lachnospiraceae bacterium]